MMSQTRRGFLGAVVGASAVALVAKTVTAAPSEQNQAVTLGKALAKDRGGRRWAYMTVDIGLLEDLLPPGTTYDFYSGIGEVNYEWLERALLLPPDAKIIGISQHMRFIYNEIAIRIEAPQFRMVPEGCCMQRVEAVYRRRLADDKAEFVKWDGI